jgi:hypothetical protein
VSSSSGLINGLLTYTGASQRNVSSLACQVTAWQWNSVVLVSRQEAVQSEYCFSSGRPWLFRILWGSHVPWSYLGRAWDSSVNIFSTCDILQNFNAWTFYERARNAYVTTGTISSICCDVVAFCWPVNYANPEYVQWKMMQVACVPLNCAAERFLGTLTLRPTITTIKS